MDRTELAEPLEKKTVLGLPSKDAIVLDFDNSDFFGHPRKPREEFVKLVDDSLRRRLPDEHELEGQKRMIQFSLAIGTVGQKEKDVDRLLDDVDRWLGLVTKHCVTELKLSLYTDETPIRYKFPPASFNVGSLVVLSLYNCVLEKALIQEDTIFCCLKELMLWCVNFNGLVVGDLLSRCPSLETLKLISCENIKYLQLCDLPKLKKFKLISIKDTDEVCSYMIEAPNLESLLFSEDERPLDLEAVDCRNLKKLHIVHHGSTITNQYIQDVVSKFPLLENLFFNAESFGLEDEDQVNVSSHQLEKLAIVGDTHQKNIKIDAPNLLSYTREGNEIPPSLSLKSGKLEKVHLQLYDIPPLDTTWFLKLRDYLGKITPHNSYSLLMNEPSESVKFSLEDIREEKIPPPPKFMKLILLKASSSVDSTAFIEGLLWSCHPTTIVIRSGLRDEPDRKFIKLLYKILMDREEKSLCCGGNKCWRHYLKSVKIIEICFDIEEEEDGGEEDDGLGIHVQASKDNEWLDGCHVTEDAVFELQWSSED